MDQLISILEGIRADVDYSMETELIDDGILNSLDITNLVLELNEAYDIEIGMEEMIPENFNSAEAIYNLIQELEDENKTCFLHLMSL